MSEVCLQGLPASPGILVGNLVTLRPLTDVATRVAGDPLTELGALDRAIGSSIGELVELSARVQGEGADILSFQIAMLEDETLSGPARLGIERGQSADLAWLEALEAQVAEYQSADDEYFRARAGDLVDIKDRVLRHLAGGAETTSVPTGSILAADDLAPSRFLAMDWSSGGAVALTRGSPTSHVAMLARSRGVPMVVGLGQELLRWVGKVGFDGTAAVDGGRGLIVVEPGAERRAELLAQKARDDDAKRAAASYRDKPALTLDGSRIEVLINVADSRELDHLDPVLCDGIGLVRTELMFHGGGPLPDEETQLAVYRRIVAWAQGRPVTFRTLDAGGDKPIPGLTIDGESNPFLGLRGLRLSLMHPAVFETQLRALCRAAVLGPTKIMLPMISVPAELEAARSHLDHAIADLQTAGKDHARPPLGIMVEVPSVALTPERFAAEFFSIGSNDLTQYVLAAARDLDSVAAIASAADPSVLRLICEVATHGRKTSRQVSLCGDAASDVTLVPALLQAGLLVLSVAPSAVGRVKAAIAATRLGTSNDDR